MRVRTLNAQQRTEWPRGLDAKLSLVIEARIDASEIDWQSTFWELCQSTRASVPSATQPHLLCPSLLRAVKMPVSRSLVSVLRTTRVGLSQARGANPVNRVFGHDRFAARTYATVFERNKPHVNIGRPASVPN